MIQLFYIIGFLIILTFAIGAVSAAPWLPTKNKQRQALTEIIPLKKGNVVYDLGCGDGVVLFDLVKKNKEIKAIGFEISLLPYFIAKIRKVFNFNKYRNVKVKFRNFFKQNLEDADVVFIFLLSKCYARLGRKFANELKDDALVIVEAWPLPDLEPYKKIKQEKLLSIYFYKGHQFKK